MKLKLVSILQVALLVVTLVFLVTGVGYGQEQPKDQQPPPKKKSLSMDMNDVKAAPKDDKAKEEIKEAPKLVTNPSPQPSPNTPAPSVDNGEFRIVFIPFKQPSKPALGESSFDETMNFLKERFDHSVVVNFPTGKIQKTYKLISSHPCFIEFSEIMLTEEIPEKSSGKANFNIHISIFLSDDLQENVRVSKDEIGYCLRLLTSNRQNLIRVSVDSTIQEHTKPTRHEKISDYPIYFNSKEEAEKVAKVFSHAIKLCRASPE